MGGTNDTRALSINQHPQFSYLGVPAAAGTSHSYESMSRTTIRDILPARHSGFRRSRGGGGTL